MEAEFSLRDGTQFLMEINEPEGVAIQRVALPSGRRVVKSTQLFEETLEHVKPVALAIADKFHGLNSDGVEVKFGLKFTADAGVVFARAGSEVNFEVTLSWKPIKQNKVEQ